MPTQMELIAELQASEFQRFRTVEEMYENPTRNPWGQREINLARAMNVITASKFVGWPQGRPETFVSQASQIVVDYLTGAYIETLATPYQDELRNPTQLELWFDVAQTSVFLSLLAKNPEAIRTISSWVQYGMREDSGIEEVSRAVNYLLEATCAVLRGEALPNDFSSQFLAKQRRKYEPGLSQMMSAVSANDTQQFQAGLQEFDSKWPGNSKHAHMHEIVSIEGSILCMLFYWKHGNEIHGANNYRSILCDLRGMTQSH